MLSLYENERLDVVNDNLSLIQKTDGLTFGTDALLLAAYVRKTKGRALELGSGSGIISLLLATREKCAHILAAEIQADYAELTRRNIALNNLTDKVSVVKADVRDTALLGEAGSYDLVFTNPPYMTADSGFSCKTDAKTIARHELFGSVEDFIATAARMLKFGGSFYIVLHPARTADFFAASRQNGLEPKRFTPVCARMDLPPSMFLAECKRGGKPGLVFTKPLILSSLEDFNYIMENGNMPEGF